MIHARSNTVGIDKRINSIQSKLEAKFISLGLLTGTFDIYDRIYKLKDGQDVTPVKFSKELSKSLFTTDKAVVCYFYEKTNPVNTNGLYSVTIGNVFHVNLETLFPSVTHRADYEFIKVITDLYRYEPYGFKLENVITGPQVFSDFSFETTIEDIPPYFSLRVDLNINYRI